MRPDLFRTRTVIPATSAPKALPSHSRSVRGPRTVSLVKRSESYMREVAMKNALTASKPREVRSSTEASRVTLEAKYRRASGVRSARTIATHAIPGTGLGVSSVMRDGDTWHNFHLGPHSRSHEYCIVRLCASPAYSNTAIRDRRVGRPARKLTRRRRDLQLNLGDAAVHGQFDACDVTAVVGGEEEHGFCGIVGGPQPTERHACDCWLRLGLDIHLRGRQQAVEAGGIGNARTHHVYANVTIFEIVGRGPRKRSHGCLGGAIDAIRRSTFVSGDRSVQHNRASIWHQRQRLLNRKEETLNIRIEYGVKELLCNGAERTKSCSPRVRK